MRLIPFLCLTTALCSFSNQTWCMHRPLTQSQTPPEWTLTTENGTRYTQEVATGNLSAFFSGPQGSGQPYDIPADSITVTAERRPNDTYTVCIENSYPYQLEEEERDRTWHKARTKEAALRFISAQQQLINNPATSFNDREIRSIGYGIRPASPIIDWDAPATPVLSRTATALSRASTNPDLAAALVRAASQQSSLSRNGSQNPALSQSGSQATDPRPGTPAVSPKSGEAQQQALTRALSSRSNTGTSQGSVDSQATIQVASQQSTQSLE